MSKAPPAITFAPFGSLDGAIRVARKHGYKHVAQQNGEWGIVTDEPGERGRLLATFGTETISARSEEPYRELRDTWQEVQ